MKHRVGIIARIALALLWIYRCCISPFKPRCCRFTPSCSTYARDAFMHHGFLRGGWMTLRRIFRCHPLYKGSLHDPVPIPEDFTGKGGRGSK